MNIWLIRYSELFLKSEYVKKEWELRLVDSIRKRLPGAEVTRERGRIWVSGDVDEEILKTIFGIVSFSPCEPVKLSDLNDRITGFAEESGIRSATSFAIKIHRVGDHPFNSQQKEHETGAIIQNIYPHLKVDLNHPGFLLNIEIRNDACYLYTRSISGPGGLPPGVSGTVVALMSGGIDSPVAVYMMMKRGCRVIPVYVKIPPFHDDSSEDRSEKVVQALKRYDPEIRLITIEEDFVYNTRMKLRDMDKEKFICVLCKRHLYRLAAEVAEKYGAKGIVTGESLSQVASQTLDNLFVIDRAVPYPIYRPLIGFDKEEIITVARRIGTFEPSIMQVPSCCCAIPFKPATRSDPDLIEDLEADVGVNTYR